MVAVEAREGQTLNANYDTPVLLRIADLSTMTVRSDVSEADVVQLTPGMPVWFTTLGFPDRRFRAALRQVLPAPPVRKESEAESAVVTYVALFDVQNAGGALLPGMTAQAFFVTESAAQVLTVPVSALEGGLVRVQDASGRVEARRVETGMRTRAFVEVTLGLAEGEQVVTGIRSAKGDPLLRLAP